MLICGYCGHVFKEEDCAGGKQLFHGSETEPPEYEELKCPECGCDAITEADQCKVCGKWYLKEHSYDLCPECQRKVNDGIRALVDEVLDGMDYADAWDAILEYITEAV